MKILCLCGKDWECFRIHLDENRLSNNIKIIYCPRCGFKGKSRLELFTPAIFSDFRDFLFINFQSLFLFFILCLILWFCILFLFPLLIVIFFGSLLDFITKCFERVCPVCKNSAIVDLKEHLEDSKDKNHLSQYLDDVYEIFDKNNEDISLTVRIEFKSIYNSRK